MTTNNSFIIPLVLKNGIHHAFVRANLNILNKYSELLPDTLTFKEKMPILKELWEKEYNVKVMFTDEYGFCWSALEFNSESERTLFLLAWSSE
jgi:hypothetical protein